MTEAFHVRCNRGAQMLRKSLLLIAIAAAWIAGRVTSAQSGNGIGTVRIEARPEDTAGSAKAVVRVTEATRVIGAPASVTADFTAIRSGQWVRVWFVGPVRESYPVQANAGTIVIDSAGVQREAQQGTSPSAADSIVLERSMCYGTCPAYRLRLSRGGEIRFESRNPGDEGRSVADTVTAMTLPSLVSRARSIGFFELPREIAADSVLCKSRWTDYETVVVSIFARDGRWRVQDYSGCFDTVDRAVLPPIARLRSFEDEIDSVLRSSRWVRPVSRR
jgi:Domain of unknown function (DUF6438)/Protein of unknown function (DUF3221)